MGNARGLFFFILVFYFKTVDIKKFCWWLNSKRGLLVSDATTLPTEPQLLPKIIQVANWVSMNKFELLT